MRDFQRQNHLDFLLQTILLQFSEVLSAYCMRLPAGVSGHPHYLEMDRQETVQNAVSEDGHG